MQGEQHSLFAFCFGYNRDTVKFAVPALRMVARMSLVLLLLGIFLLIKGDFRFLGRDIPKDQGRLIGIVLAAPFTISFCASFYIVSTYISTLDPAMLDSMDGLMAIMDTPEYASLMTLEVISMIISVAVASYLIFSRPPTPPGVRAEFPPMVRPPSASYPVSSSPYGARTAAPSVMTVSEAAAYLRVPEADIEGLINDGKLPAARTASGYRIARSAIDDYLTNG